jgi:hypothetical protein
VKKPISLLDRQALALQKKIRLIKFKAVSQKE